jgi:hypothetical protein
VTLTGEIRPRSRKRRPSLKSLIKAAERSGKTVTSVARGDVTLSFGEPPPSEATNPWLKDLQ